MDCLELVYKVRFSTKGGKRPPPFIGSEWGSGGRGCKSAHPDQKVAKPLFLMAGEVVRKWKEGELTTAPPLISLDWSSQWMKKEFSCYPPREMLSELAKMGKQEREKHLWFGLYLWEKDRR